MSSLSAMKSFSVLIGVSASLNAIQSVHRNTFMRALEMAQIDCEKKYDVICNLDFYDDKAHPDEAAAAAQYFCATPVDCVVGHYASGAAIAAAPYYEKAGIPLFLPAATADCLGQYTTSFRLCGSDRQLAQVLLIDVIKRFDYHTLSLQHDTTVHGNALAQTIQIENRKCITPLPIHIVSDNFSNEVQAHIFVGDFSNSIQFVNTCRARGDKRPIILTDDAVHPDLPNKIIESENIYVYGFAPSSWYESAEAVCTAYEKIWGSIPGTYFLETYAAIEIIYTLFQQYGSLDSTLDLLKTKSWQTVLGKIKLFDRQINQPHYALWGVVQGNLQPLIPLDVFSSLI